MGYELNVASQSHVPDMPEIRPAPHEQVEGFFAHLERTCLRSVFSPRRTPRA